MSITTATDILDMISKHSVKFIDLRFCDLLGKEQHVSLPANAASSDALENLFQDGKMFDGSSIKGWKSINESDMVLLPEPSTAVLDPFTEETTLILRCDVLDPQTMQSYSRGPRSVAKRAEAFLKSTGIADVAYFGPEPEFFIFDDVRFDVGMRGAFYHVDAHEGAWNSGSEFVGGNAGHRPKVRGGYFPVPPVDSMQDIRSAMCLTLESMGIEVEAHHHEVAGSQNEIATRFNTLVRKADELMMLKYVVQNVAHAYGKTATFMPKPLVGDNGSGMHVHTSLFKDEQNIFTGDKYAGLSETGLYYLGGIIKHAQALNAFTNPATNSYKRLVPGFEAPVLLAYSACNRSAAIRIPHAANPRARRMEIRFPDPMANPYLAFAAITMAGLDGIRNKIDPGEPMDKNLYDLPPELLHDIPTVCYSLRQAIDSLHNDHTFLMEGDVFSDDMLQGHIELLEERVSLLNNTTHPIEFIEYYSL